MWHVYDGMGWWMVFAGVLWLLLWASLVGFGAWALGGARRRRDPGSADALEILRRRYACGEIGPDEFERIRDHLLAKEG
jgi:uncharacterized membrane protein